MGSEGEVFRKALSNMTLEAACGGAVRHLADAGYTAGQIRERLDYPASFGQIQNLLYRHLCDTCVILEEAPDRTFPREKPQYVLEYNSYGKPSYRRAGNLTGRGQGEAGGADDIPWKELVFEKECFGAGPGRAELDSFLRRRMAAEEESGVYLSCDFGIPQSRAAAGVALLNDRQREYLEGIPWPRRRVYHRLDGRMREILCSLYEKGAYEGVCYFGKQKEKIRIGDRI